MTKPNTHRLIPRAVIAFALPMCLATSTLLAQSNPLLLQARHKAAITHHGGAQQKSTATGSRRVAESTYYGTASGALTPVDSSRYFFPGVTSNLYNQSVDLSYSGGAWHKGYLSNLTFDANGFLTQDATVSWNTATAGWDSSSRALYTNNAAGKVTNQIAQTWDNTTHSWVNYYNYLFTYDANNHPTDEIDQQWIGGTWVNTSHTIYTNNAQGNPTQSTFQNWLLGAWVNSNRSDYTYDAGGTSVTTETFSYWNTTTSTWINANRNLFTLNSLGERTQETYQNWNATTAAWESNNRYTFTYDASKNLTLVVQEMWNATSNAFENYAETIYTYNSFDQLLTNTTLYWSSGTYAVTANTFRNNYYYESYTTGIGSEVSSGTELSIYPNPAKTNLSISLRWNIAQSFNASITDMSGRVYTNFSAPSANSFNTTLSIFNLPVGNYMLSIKGSNGGSAAGIVTVAH